MRHLCRLAALALLAAGAAAFLDGSKNGVLDAPPSVKAYGANEVPEPAAQGQPQAAEHPSGAEQSFWTGVPLRARDGDAAPHHASPAEIRGQPHASPQAAPDAAPQQANEATSESVHVTTALATNLLRDTDLLVARAESEAAQIQLDAKKVENEAAKELDAHSGTVELGESRGDSLPGSLGETLTESLGEGKLYRLVTKLNQDAKHTKLFTEEAKVDKNFKAVAGDLSAVTNANKHPQENGKTGWNSAQEDAKLVEEIKYLKEEAVKQEEAEASTHMMGQSLHALLGDTKGKNLEQTELDASKLYVTAQEVANLEYHTGSEDEAREQGGAMP